MPLKNHCEFIHSGISLAIDNFGEVVMKPCCMSDHRLVHNNLNLRYFDSTFHLSGKEQNARDEWHVGCDTCKHSEAEGLGSYRLDANQRFKDIGQNEISCFEIRYANSCNLACRTCGPWSSSTWIKQLKEHDLLDDKFKVIVEEESFEQLVETQLRDVTAVRQMKVSGGEPMMNNSYWNTMHRLIQHNPTIFENLEVIIQTNGTIPIRQIHLDFFEHVKDVKLSLSVDGFGRRFEYLRWPGKWDELVQNINGMLDIIPAHASIMFEETRSIFNAYYRDELKDWLDCAFSDRVGYNGYGYHLAHGVYSLDAMPASYAKYMGQSKFTENPELIKRAVEEINQFDAIRDQKFADYFPEVFSFYKPYF